MTANPRYAEWRARNPNNYEAQKRAKARKRAWIDGIKAERGCAECDEHDPRKLEFHHRDPTTKLFPIGHSDVSQERVAREIAKCDVLCRPCHVAAHRKIKMATQ